MLEPSSTTSISLHEKLRAHTDAIHLRLHEHPLLTPLLSENITIVQYRAILEAFYHFYSQAEEAYSEHTGSFVYESRPLELLVKDFTALEWPVPSPIRKLSEISFENSTYAHYIGYTYVKQGSSLGGQHISKALKNNLGLTRQKNLFFFNGYGKKTAERWRTFLQFLSQQNVNAEEAKSSSFRAFEAMNDMFDNFYKESARLI